jgi:hypothetical protein
VGSYAEINEIGIDPVKPRQLLCDSAAAFDVISQALR